MSRDIERENESGLELQTRKERDESICVSGGIRIAIGTTN